MKRLYLLRHAKSSWGDPGLADHERPLNARGQAAARVMARHLASHDLPPQAILASTARRVAETLEILRPDGGLESAPVLRDRGLYLAEPPALLSRLRQAPADADSLMMVGHNPGLHDFALRLAGEVGAANMAMRQNLRAAYPTCALAVIDFPLAENWQEIGWGDGRLEDFVTPKGLAEPKPS
ncbi:MAG: SixA phosphatase family protein [Alphaproteobacteria bacterium]